MGTRGLGWREGQSEGDGDFYPEKKKEESIKKCPGRLRQRPAGQGKRA